MIGQFPGREHIFQHWPMFFHKVCTSPPVLSQLIILNASQCFLNIFADGQGMSSCFTYPLSSFRSDRLTVWPTCQHSVVRDGKLD